MSGGATTTPAAALEEHPQRKPFAWVALLLAGLFAIAGFVALGMWQVNRLAWKTDLIERVDQRLKTPPAPAPGAQEWPALDHASAEYRHALLLCRPDQHVVWRGDAVPADAAGLMALLRGARPADAAAAPGLAAALSA